MLLYEYQAKTVLSQYGIEVPQGLLIEESKFAAETADTLFNNNQSDSLVLKAQIRSGGRGKAGGIRLLKNTKEVADAAKELLGAQLVTAQTGEKGETVNALLLEHALKIKKELYVSFTVDREAKKTCVITSSEGGMDIEKTAALYPEKIGKYYFTNNSGLLPFEARNIAFSLGLNKTAANNLTKAVVSLSKLFVAEDASMVEINPLAITEDDRAIAVDAKISLDDNAAFRHKERKAFIEETEITDIEAVAAKLGFSYVAMGGEIGCCVNGAGLAMATMDMISYVGGKPANFLDVGGSADAETVKKAFSLVLTDPKVKSVFVNIFGGILHCDLLAKGVVKAVKEMGITVPMIVRLEGTNAEQGRKILEESGLQIITASDMEDGARKATAAATKA